MSDNKKSLLVLIGTSALIIAVENRKSIAKFIKRKLSIKSPTPTYTKYVYILNNPIMGKEQNVANEQNFYDTEEQ